MPPSDDGREPYTRAHKLRFVVQVNDGQLDIAVLDQGPGNPPGNAAINGIALVAGPSPTSYVGQPRITRTSRDAGQLGILVNPETALARFQAGEISLRLQSSPDPTSGQLCPCCRKLPPKERFSLSPRLRTTPRFIGQSSRFHLFSDGPSGWESLGRREPGSPAKIPPGMAPNRIPG